MAEAYLRSQGLLVLDRNWRNGRHGELDLVLTDNGAIVFVEVKTRSGPGVAEAVSPQKLRRLRTLAGAWLSDNARGTNYRLDLVGIQVGPSGAQLTWWKGIDR